MEYKGIFDTHAHYDDERFDEDRDTVLKNVFEHGVSLIVDLAFGNIQFLGDRHDRIDCVRI